MARITSITPITGSGLPEALSGEIFDQISLFAGYGFNKSHAAAYAAIAFRTAWLKRHHPEAFFASAMNLNASEVDEIAVFAAEMKERRIPFFPPSINQSQGRFVPLRLKRKVAGYDHGIAYALSGIRGIGQAPADAIFVERKRGGAFRSVDDFLTRMRNEVPRTALQALAKAGAFDCLGLSRSEALSRVTAREAANDIRQISMFDMLGDTAPSLATVELTRDEELDNEFDVLGHYMTGHPLEPLAGHLFEDNLYFSDKVLRQQNSRLRRADMAAVVTGMDVRRTKTGEVMASIMLSDPEGVYEVTAFSDTWSEIRDRVKKKARLVFEVAISSRDNERRLIVDNVQPLQVRMAVAA